MTESNISLQSFNFYHEKSVSIGRYIVPLKVHIKDINEQHTKRISNRRYGETLDLTQDHFDKAYEEIEKDYKIQYYLKFINTEDVLFPNSRTFLTHNYFNTIEDFLNIIGYTELQELINEIEEIMKDIISEFFDKAKVFLGGEKLMPSIYLKEDKDALWDKIVEYINRPQGYLISQLAIEFSGNIIFSENIGKAISEWSFREIQLQLMYISEKHKIDSILEKYKAKKQEDITSKTNK